MLNHLYWSPWALRGCWHNWTHCHNVNVTFHFVTEMFDRLDSIVADECVPWTEFLLPWKLEILGENRGEMCCSFQSQERPPACTAGADLDGGGSAWLSDQCLDTNESPWMFYPPNPSFFLSILTGLQMTNSCFWHWLGNLHSLELFLEHDFDAIWKHSDI